VKLSPYPLDNDHELADEHHDGLAELLDPDTIARLDGLDTDWTTAACLEVGAGGGSIARHLADRVGAAGRVVAIDLKPQHIRAHPKLTVLAHDLTGGDPLPAGPWDLIHARLVLSHIPQREVILRRLAAALAPGGVLLTEDWEARVTGVVVAAPGPEAAELYQRYQQTVSRDVFSAAGTDRTWARRAHTAMRQVGLVDVETTVSARFWIGGGAGCRLAATIMFQLKERLYDAGMTPGEIAELGSLMADPRTVIHGHPLYSTSGRRPHQGTEEGL
jgi:SAM-dependent methyltransferase